MDALPHRAFSLDLKTITKDRTSEKPFNQQNRVSDGTLFYFTHGIGAIADRLYLQFICIRLGPGPTIEKAFEAQCGCDLNYVALDDGVSILNRLRLEGSSTQADIVLGLDNNLMSEAKKSGLLANHGADLSSVVLPNGWSDDVFVPFDYGYFAFVYNKEKVKNPPKSLKELVEQRDDLKVIYQDPRTSTPGQGLLLWMKSVYGDDSSAAWQQLSKKTVTVTKGWSEAYSMFLEGESDLVLSYTTSPAYHIIAEQDERFAAADFAEGTTLK